MVKTKLERIASIEEEIKQLENRRKELMQQQKEQERKARTRRLIERGAILESFIPDADIYTGEQIKDFLTKTFQSDSMQRELAVLKEQAQPMEPAEPPSGANEDKTRDAARIGG